VSVPVPPGSHSRSNPTRLGALSLGALLALLLVLTGVAAASWTGAGSVGGVQYSATPSHLVVKVAAQPNSTYSGATVVLRAWVTGNGTLQSGITVSFSSSGAGSFSPSTGTTGQNGEVNTSFMAPTVTSTQTLVLTASASSTGSGFLPGSGSANLTLHPTGPFLTVTPSFPQGTSIHSASSDLIVGRVTDQSGAPVGGANVTLEVTRGTVTPMVGVSGPSGNVTFTLRAPTVTNATQDGLLFIANATGYANGSAIAFVTVNSGVATSLYVTINPVTGSLPAGEAVHVSVTVRSSNATGTLVAGANVTLILSDGQYSPAQASTTTQGTANFTFVAPTSLAKASLVTVTASATATNFAPGSATASYTVAAASTPPPPSFWSSYWLWLLVVLLVAVVILVIALAARRRPRAPPPTTPPSPPV